MPDNKDFNPDIITLADDDGKEYDDSSHGRCAFLLHLTLQSEVADLFSDLFLLDPADDVLACKD